MCSHVAIFRQAETTTRSFFDYNDISMHTSIVVVTMIMVFNKIIIIKMKSNAYNVCQSVCRISYSDIILLFKCICCVFCSLFSLSLYLCLSQFLSVRLCSCHIFAFFWIIVCANIILYTIYGIFTIQCSVFGVQCAGILSNYYYCCCCCVRSFFFCFPFLRFVSPLSHI